MISVASGVAVAERVLPERSVEDVLGVVGRPVYRTLRLVCRVCPSRRMTAGWEVGDAVDEKPPLPYSSECVEGKFSEVSLEGALESRNGKSILLK